MGNFKSKINYMRLPSDIDIYQGKPVIKNEFQDSTLAVFTSGGDAAGNFLI